MLSYVKNSLHVCPCLNVISEFPYKLLYFSLSSPYKPLYYAWVTFGINFSNDGPSTNFSDEFFCSSSQDFRLLIPLSSPFNSFYKCLIVTLGYEKETRPLLDCQQSLFCSKIPGEERKTSRSACVTVSVTCEPRCCELLVGSLRNHDHNVTGSSLKKN